ncbi:MAG: hypothetical protein IPP66_11780 [Anaerolineales bacterium]|nr:hypothetical protein [Anaerolineales bacterium]
MNGHKKKIVLSIIVLCVLTLLIDRFYWSEISQWREDQATNLWLGYTTDIWNMPVGLMSSKVIPNPNGMLLLGIVLSVLPNLLSVSFILGIIQITLLILVGWEAFGKQWQYFILAIIPLLSSVILRSISVEFWNQYIITLINVFFIFWVIRHLKNKSLWNLPPIVALIILAPSIYHAGVANAAVMAIITIGALIYTRPVVKDGKLILSVIALEVAISLFVTWLPYYQSGGLGPVIKYNQTNWEPSMALQLSLKSLFQLPIYTTAQWADKSLFSSAFKHADSNIISPVSNLLLASIGKIYMAQAIFSFLTFIYLIIIRFINVKNTKVNSSAARVVITSGIFIVLSYTLSAFFGGPSWMDGKRLDQTAQFFPLFLLVIFLLPHVITTNGLTYKLINGVSYFLVGLFCITNLVCGFLIIRDHLQYRGNVLSEADVPLIDKMQAVDFIAKDWKEHSDSNFIPVDYDLGGGKWDWIPTFGDKLSPWYPAPMTIGRSFDYELLRRYGLTNQQEGIQFRTFGGGKYLVTYVFEDPPTVKKGNITHYIFGRLRVSVVE